MHIGDVVRCIIMIYTGICQTHAQKAHPSVVQLLESRTSAEATAAPVPAPNGAEAQALEVLGQLDKALRELGFGIPEIQASRRSVGPALRLRRVIKKAMVPGTVINVVILGGSISTGSGLNCPDEACARSHPKSYFRTFETWWKKTFVHSSLIVTNAAIPATGSEYFKFCYTSYIGPNIDLVILETSINDAFYTSEGGGGSRINEGPEELVRGVTAAVSHPAVISINFLSGLGPDSSILRSGCY
jgi:hypothetical protein